MSILGSLFGASDLQATGDKYDALNSNAATERYAPGGVTYEKIKAQKGQAAADAAWARVQGDYVSGATGDVNTQLDTAFAEGWKDGQNNVSGFIGGVFKVVGDVFKAVLFGIPAWAWLLAAGAIWGWLGFPGLKSLKKKLA